MSQDTFKVKIEDKDTEFKVNKPTLAQQREAQKFYNQAFSDAVKSGSIVRAKLDDLLTDQGLWDDNKQARFVAIQTDLTDSEKRLASGGISLDTARGIAINMKRLREEMRDLISVRTNLDTHTAEGQADNARFNYMVSCCVVYSKNNKPYFAGYEDYLNRSSDPVGVLGAQKLAAMMYGLDSEFEKKLPENQFLIDYNFVNEDLRYINDNGKLTDEEGRLVDESGRYIDANGKYVDRDGNPVDVNGEYLLDFAPFTDSDGKPVPNKKQAVAKPAEDSESTTEDKPKVEATN